MNLPIFDLDAYLKPHPIGCLKCGGEAVVYPTLKGDGDTACPTCSPEWLASFLRFRLNGERLGHDLDELEA